jgi:hypothetical protein
MTAPTFDIIAKALFGGPFAYCSDPSKVAGARQESSDSLPRMRGMACFLLLSPVAFVSKGNSNPYTGNTGHQRAKT